MGDALTKQRYTDEDLLRALRLLVADEKANFRDDQKAIIRSILKGRDVLGILPTSGGKSACYQIPAMLTDELTLVISPLVALMEDQANTLRKRGISVACLTSGFLLDKDGFHRRERYQQTLEDLDEPGSDDPPSFRKISQQIYLDTSRGEYKILYVTPERLRMGPFIRFAQKTRIGLIAVDEAHCVSLWGYDFRPRYLEIPRFIQRLGYHPTLAAFTATASEYVQKDILSILGLKNCKVYASSAVRKDLMFSVLDTDPKLYKKETGKALKTRSEVKLDRLDTFLREHPYDQGYVYCTLVADVDLVYSFLKEKGYPVTRYHAKLDKEPNKEPYESTARNLEDFRTGKKRIMVATSALGMGMDIRNIRFVFHYSMPVNLEDYYQQAGRAGRENERRRSSKPSQCVLCAGDKEDYAVCMTLLELSVNQSRLPDNVAAVRKKISEQRLWRMYGYTGKVGAGSEDLHETILRYFRSFTPKLSDEETKILQDYLSFQVKDIDVLYINRTKIAQEMRKGHMEGKDLVVGRAFGDLPAPTVSYRLENGPLSYTDLMIADAVYTLMKHRVKRIYARSVLEVLSGVDGITLRPERKEQIEDSIRRMMNAHITIDRTGSLGYGFVYDDEIRLTTLEGPFLPLKEEKNGFSYDCNVLPPLYQYAEILNGQFFSVASRHLEKIFSDSLPTSMENLSIAHYLFCRTDMIPRKRYNKKKYNAGTPNERSYPPRAVTRASIRLDTLIKTLGIPLGDESYYRNRKLDTIWKKAAAVLSSMWKTGFIGYLDAEKELYTFTVYNTQDPLLEPYIT